MSHQERMKRLNAAFDAMSEGLIDTELADMTSAMTGVKTIADVLRHRIRLFQGLRELLGFPPDLIDATLYEEAVIADLVKRAVQI